MATHAEMVKTHNRLLYFCVCPNLSQRYWVILKTPKTLEDVAIIVNII